MTESLYRQYKQIENQNPESLVFSVKNGEYTCFGKTAEEIIVLSDMSPDYFKAENGEVKMLRKRLSGLCKRSYGRRV